MPKGKPFTFAEQAEFVEVWQRAKDIGQVCRTLGIMDPARINSRACELRTRGVMLKHFRPISRTEKFQILTPDEVEQLRKLAVKHAPKAVA